MVLYEWVTVTARWLTPTRRYGGQVLHAQPAGASLRRLDLSDNPMTAEVAPALAEVLLRHPGLVALNLNDTSLTNEGVSAIAQSLHASVGSLQVRQPRTVSSSIGLVLLSPSATAAAIPTCAWQSIHCTASTRIMA